MCSQLCSAVDAPSHRLASRGWLARLRRPHRRPPPCSFARKTTHLLLRSRTHRASSPFVRVGRLFHQSEGGEARDDIEVRRQPARAPVCRSSPDDHVARHLDIEALEVGVERLSDVSLSLGQKDLLVLRLGPVHGREHVGLGLALDGDGLRLKSGRLRVGLLDVKLRLGDGELLLLLYDGKALHLALLDGLSLGNLLGDLDLALVGDHHQLLLPLRVLHLLGSLDLLFQLLGACLGLRRLLFLHRLDALSDETLLVHEKAVEVILGARVADQHLRHVDPVLCQRVLRTLHEPLVVGEWDRLPHELLRLHKPRGALLLLGADRGEVSLFDLDLPTLRQVNTVAQLICQLRLELIEPALKELLARVLRRRDHGDVGGIAHEEGLYQVGLGAELAVELSDTFSVKRQLEAERHRHRAHVRVREARRDGVLTFERRRDDLPVLGD
mmetsp:Transcript_30394/g.78802  ORF Transcript_30394/g.78802 Transcript_30394/m.78802 type:complete len:441 (+) Transcript_30394:794-2116(+)